MNDVRFEMNRSNRMNIGRIALFIVQTMVLVPSSILAHTPAETNRLVRILADRASSFSSCDTPDPNEVVRVPDYTNPDVFFSRSPKLEGWSRAEKEAAFISYLNNELWKIDFNDESFRTDIPGIPLDPDRIVFCCVNMNCTNVLPGIRRMAFNRSLARASRLSVLEGCVDLSPVDDASTEFFRTIFTNRTDFTVEDRREAFNYSDKIVSVARSNLVSRTVCDRAALMLYRDTPSNEGRLAACYDRFMSSYFDGYVTSSNRLAYLSTMLSNTNFLQEGTMSLVRQRFISATNQLMSLSQPLQQLTIGEGGNE